MSDLESEADDPLELALMECCEFEPTNSLQLATIKLEGPVKQEDTDDEMVEDSRSKACLRPMSLRMITASKRLAAAC